MTMKHELFQDQVEVTFCSINDPRGGGNSSDHSEESDADNDVTDYDDAPSGN